jgi:glutathione S-transferase
MIGPEKGSADYQVALPCACLLHTYRFEIADATRRKSAEFRALNPLGQILVLRDADVLLADSNAIMVQLVKRYAPTSDWLPDDPVTAASLASWSSTFPTGTGLPPATLPWPISPAIHGFVCSKVRKATWAGPAVPG